MEVSEGCLAKALGEGYLVIGLGGAFLAKDVVRRMGVGRWNLKDELNCTDNSPLKLLSVEFALITSFFNLKENWYYIAQCPQK